MKDYIEQAALTASDQYHGDLVPMRILNANIINFVANGQRLDTIKKSLFYGRDNGFGIIPGEPDCSNLKDKRAQEILHGILGCATESAELFEQFLTGKYDPVNIKEECGDILWYIAMLGRATGFTIEECMETNIAKLRKRFGEKFTEYDANNRDLNAEREVLEGSGV